MENQWRIAPHDPEWRDRFLDLGIKLREALGELVVRIDHVGSTSVPGLDAKPIISKFRWWTLKMYPIIKAKLKVLDSNGAVTIRTKRKYIFVKCPEIEGLIFMSEEREAFPNK